jgi:glycosyltransferase involved in cell wall biosynthesis
LHVLINDFIGGVLDRGIPLYVRNIVFGLEEEGFRVSVVRAPAICRRLPRGIFYLIAVVFEQAVMPVIGALKRADITLYPYNSIALIDLLTGRGRIVVHDLEQLNRAPSPSKLYYLACYRALKWRKRPIFTIMELTRRRLLKSGLFGDCPITILPVTFYAFEKLLAANPGVHKIKNSLLLCTGSNPNKDFDTLASDYLPKVLAAGFTVTVVGLHKAGDAARVAALQKFLDSGQLRLCGQISDAEVAAEYQKHETCWVHSLREGFGRCLVEGRLAGSRVICSDIPEFSTQRDEMGEREVYLYRNPAEFMAVLERLARSELPPAPFNGYPYREMLRSAVRSGL